MPGHAKPTRGGGGGGGGCLVPTVPRHPFPGSQEHQCVSSLVFTCWNMSIPPTMHTVLRPMPTPRASITCLAKYNEGERRILCSRIRVTGVRASFVPHSFEHCGVVCCKGRVGWPLLRCGSCVSLPSAGGMSFVNNKHQQRNTYRPCNKSTVLGTHR